MAQADQVVQNNIGSTVRADINDNLAALFSNSSGAAAPATTTAYMWWADTNNDELKIRNSTDDAFITVGTLSATNLGLATAASPSFTGNVNVPAGTVSSLSFRFTGDTNTGFYRNSADDFSVVTGGTRRAHFDSNGITIRDRKALRLRDTSNSNFVAIQAPSNVSSDVTLTLPDSDGNADDILQTDGSGNLSFTALPQAVPTGSVHMMATTTAPTGYLKCDGAAVSRTTYADLFAVIGTTHGAGDSSTTFNVPDLRGEFVRGWDDSRGVDSSRVFGSSQSSQNLSHSHTSSTTINNHTHGGTTGGPSTSLNHSHSITNPPVRQSKVSQGGGTTGLSVEGGFSNSTVSSSTNSVNLSHTHSFTTGNPSDRGATTTIDNDGGTEARPRNIAMLYVIKT